MSIGHASHIQMKTRQSSPRRQGIQLPARQGRIEDGNRLHVVSNTRLTHAWRYELFVIAGCFLRVRGYAALPQDGDSDDDAVAGKKKQLYAIGVVHVQTIWKPGAAHEHSGHENDLAPFVKVTALQLHCDCTGTAL